MSTLSRYQKAGGFIQLLQLIETCGKTKQDAFFQLIDKEDRRWGNALREKMITMEKLFSWDDSILAELAVRLPQLTLATAMHGFKTEETDRMLKTFSHSQKRNIDDLFKSKSPSPTEISAAYFKIIQEIRAMITGNYIKPEKFAPGMVIPQNVEEAIISGAMITSSGVNEFEASNNEVPNLDGFGSGSSPNLTSVPAQSGSHGPNHHPTPHSAANESADVNTLRSRVQVLVNENTQLKGELRVLRERLAQIKKIA